MKLTACVIILTIFCFLGDYYFPTSMMIKAGLTYHNGRFIGDDIDRYYREMKYPKFAFFVAVPISLLVISLLFDSLIAGVTCSLILFAIGAIFMPINFLKALKLARKDAETS